MEAMSNSITSAEQVGKKKSHHIYLRPQSTYLPSGFILNICWNKPMCKFQVSTSMFKIFLSN